MRRRKRYARLRPPPDLWAHLGPGDPGYRLRPGRTGFDPFEQTLEYSRAVGILASAALRGRSRAYGIPGLVVLLGLLMIHSAEFFLALLLAGICALGLLSLRLLRPLLRRRH
jgi:hypothetical protein